MTQCAPINESGFDPTHGRFIAQDSRPSTLLDLDPAGLTPLMRTLLVIDGTVTKVLEAYFLEPVDVRRLTQSVDILERSEHWLDAAAGDTIVNRAVVLVGRESDQLYAFAQSQIMLNRLSGQMQARLDDENFGLGRILLDDKAEVRRECLWYGRDRFANRPDAVTAYCDSDFVCRSYRVIAGGRPLMMITERFPLRLAY